MKRRIPALIALLVLTSQVGAVSGTPGNLPMCPSGLPASTRAPEAPPSLYAPGTCQARVTSMQRSAPVPSPGYHHLGATTASGWSGVLGRLQVADPAVRSSTYDFLATRVMAKADIPGGVAWLEAGWAETGWDGGGRQRIYTYDTNRGSWTFYDQYQIKAGERFWIYLQTEQDGPSPAWQAWLWWGNGWHLLTSQELPIGSRAQIEQYVEVHTDVPFAVPQIRVDNVALKDGPHGPLLYWDATIPTQPGASTANYCLNWLNRYDTWTAGTC